MTTITAPYRVDESNAEKVLTWLRERGGIQIWKSQDLGDPSASTTTPFRGPDGIVVSSPHWKFGAHPERHITDIADVEVAVSKVVESFPIKLKQVGMRLVLNNASDLKVNTRLEHWRQQTDNDVFYTFGASGSSQGNPVHGIMHGGDVVNICVDDQVIPLSQWAQREAQN
jgi:hypothetical protein